MPPGRPFPQDHLPGAVIWAVALLGLLFLGGGVFLYNTGVFLPPLDLQIMDFPKATVVGISYQGTVLGLNSTWKKLAVELSLGKVAHGPALVVYPASPLKLRPIAVEGFAGFLAEFPLPKNLPPGVQQLELPARRMLRVRIPGQGVLTGMRAFRFAQKLQGRGAYHLVEGERFEIRATYRGQPCVEHWLPVAGGEKPGELPEEKQGPGGLNKSRWPLGR
jgi:hypothetical protein